MKNSPFRSVIQMNIHFIRLTPLILLLIVSSCGTVRIYEDPDKPVFLSNETIAKAKSDSLVILSFNVAKAEKTELAISELKGFEKKIPVDIYLLQEMDEAGVKLIAKAFQLNYLYIPNVYNTILKKNIGNAILAKGIIRDPRKLILPNTKWINGRQRQVTVGVVNIGTKEILVYSVHTETSSMKRRKRIQQWDAILQDSSKEFTPNPYIIVGGDFNTLFPRDENLLVQKFDSSGFLWAASTTGFTATALFGIIKPHEDHIFSKGFQIIDIGKIDTSKASDHLPVYTILKYE
jgi:endonuclease/exonuclease/phosphatase family metal-dependent hydrolase